MLGLSLASDGSLNIPFLQVYNHPENMHYDYLDLIALILGLFSLPLLSPSLFPQYFLPQNPFKGRFPKRLPAVGFRLHFYAGLNPGNSML